MPHLAVRHARMAALACLAVLLLATPSLGRGWSLRGSDDKVEASIVNYDGKKIELKLAQNGLVLDLPVEALSDDDRAYLKKAYPAITPAEPKETPAEPKEAPAEPKETPSEEAPPGGQGDAPPPESPEPETPRAAAKAKARASAASPRVARRTTSRVRAAKTADFDVKVVSLTVTKLPKDAREAGPATGLVPGTHATVLVTSRSKPLVAVDAEKTDIECRDDQANDLSQPLAGGEPAEEGGLNLEVAQGGQSGLVVFDFPHAPAAKATRIRLKGDLHLICGTEESPEAVKLPMTIIVSLGL